MRQSMPMYEETGFDSHCNKEGGLTHQWCKTGQADNISWKFLLEDPIDALTFLEYFMHWIRSGSVLLYFHNNIDVCKGTPKDFHFDPVCRKEVDSIECIYLRDSTEYKAFAVTPYIGQLKK